MQTDWLDDGFYKVRLVRAGPWVPVRVYLEDGERDPETWELLSDQWLRAEWAPNAASAQFYPVPVKYLINRAQPISREEFQWLTLLRTLAPSKSPRHSRQRLPLP